MVGRDNELFSFTRQKKIDHAKNITGEIAAYAYQIFYKSVLAKFDTT